VAAGKAMGEIARRVKSVSVRDVCAMEGVDFGAVLLRVSGSGDDGLRSGDVDDEEQQQQQQQILDLKLENFDVQSVLEKGIVLLSSSGDEWSNAERGPGTKTERLERAKMNLKKTLGMELGKEAAAFGLDSKTIGEMVTERDLVGDDDDDFENTNGKKKKGSKKRKKGDDAEVVEVKKEEGAAARLVDSLQAGGDKGNATSTNAGATAEDDFDEEKLRAQGMSAREINKLKRKNKRLRAAGKTVVKIDDGDAGDEDDNDDDDDKGKNKRKKSATGGGGASADVNEQQRKHEEMEEKQRQEEDEEESQEIEAGSWPFTRTCEFLAFSLFSSRWEDRHGAAVALREILRYQAECANIFIETFDTTTTSTTTGGKTPNDSDAPVVKVQPGTAEAQMRANFSWLEDISVRLLCVLALDRFGDFVGDGVVAPVRETAAQALGASLRDLPTRKVFDIGEAALTLLKHEKAWEVRHSGLIGLKYVFASIPQGEQVKMDMLAQKLLPSALPRLIVALKDDDDDVRAAAAEAALPARESLNPQLLLVKKEENEDDYAAVKIKQEESNDDDGGGLFKVFLDTLWNALLELDDLSPSARPIMSLLAKLCEKKETRDMLDVANVAPRLWPFATHPIASVREATWQTVSELAGTLLENESFVDAHLADFMTLALQGCALDEDDGASVAAKKAFLLVLEFCGGNSISSGSKTDPPSGTTTNKNKLLRQKVAEILKVKVDAFLKVLSVQVNRTCDAHYILVKKPAKMTGEARNVAADWLCRTKARLLGVECVAKALVSLLPTAASSEASTSSASSYAEEEEALTYFLNEKVMALSKHGTAAARVAAFHICAKFLETAANASINNDACIEGKFKPLYETRVFEVLACANPAYPSAPSPFPYDEAKALQKYVKNETKSLLRVCLQSNVAIEGEIPSPDADGFGAVNAVQVMETVPKVRRRIDCELSNFLFASLFFSRSFVRPLISVFSIFDPSGLAELQNLGVTDEERERVFFCASHLEKRALFYNARVFCTVRILIACARETGFSGRAPCLARSNLSKHFCLLSSVCLFVCLYKEDTHRVLCILFSSSFRTINTHTDDELERGTRSIRVGRFRVAPSRDGSETASIRARRGRRRGGCVSTAPSEAQPNYSTVDGSHATRTRRGVTIGSRESDCKVGEKSHVSREIAERENMFQHIHHGVFVSGDDAGGDRIWREEAGSCCSRADDDDG